jgi:hypothetical protein
MTEQQRLEPDQTAVRVALWRERMRLGARGFGVPEWLHLVPVDFESGESWWRQLLAAGQRRVVPAGDDMSALERPACSPPPAH